MGRPSCTNCKVLNITKQTVLFNHGKQNTKYQYLNPRLITNSYSVYAFYIDFPNIFGNNSRIDKILPNVSVPSVCNSSTTFLLGASALSTGKNPNTVVFFCFLPKISKPVSVIVVLCAFSAARVVLRIQRRT